VSSQDSSAILEVTDHGVGLSEEERAHVFEPFYRSDPSRGRGSGGAGLGLSIVAAIVAAHGGSVEALATPDGGATFRVELPKERVAAEDQGPQDGLPVIA
jgi:two-component system OmpR family sensor kinase